METEGLTRRRLRESLAGDGVYQRLLSLGRQRLREPLVWTGAFPLPFAPRL